MLFLWEPVHVKTQVQGLLERAQELRVRVVFDGWFHQIPSAGCAVKLKWELVQLL